MADTTLAEDYANRISAAELGCKPGEGGHSAAPCLRCEQIRARIADQVASAIAATESALGARLSAAVRARLSQTNAWAVVLKDNERLLTAFAALRVVFDLTPSVAAALVHEHWITVMLARGYHPFEECLLEAGCAQCDRELMAWDALPESRRLVREAGVTALFAELRRRANLDQLDAERSASEAAVQTARAALEALRATTTEDTPAP